MLQAHNDKALWHRKLIINCCFVLLGMSEIFGMSDYRSVPTLSWILTEFKTDVDKVSRVDAWVLALFSLETSALRIRIRLIHKLVLFDICVFHLMSNSVWLRGDDLQNISWLLTCVRLTVRIFWTILYDRYFTVCSCVFLCIFHCHCISNIIYCLLIFVVLQVWHHG